MLRMMLTMAAVAIGVSAVAAQDPVTARRELMKHAGEQAYGVLNRMVRDQTPYDQAKVDEAFAQLADAAQKIPSLFPPGSYTGPVAESRYYASEKIFENQADLKARATKLAKSIADAKGKVKDLDSLKAIWTTINKEECDSCHTPYRLRKN